MQASERLYLTADGERVVSEGDPDAASLFAAEGDEIDDEDAKRFGLKSKGKPANKEADRPEDKSAAKPAKKRAKRKGG